MRTFEKVVASLLLISYIIKSQLHSPNYSDSIIIACLAIFVGYMCYLETLAQPDIKQELMEIIADDRKKVADAYGAQQKEISRLKDDMGQVGIVAKRNGGNVPQYKY